MLILLFWWQVLIFLNMCSDVANFFFMLFFFLMAFSVLIFGTVQSPMQCRIRLPEPSLLHGQSLQNLLDSRATLPEHSLLQRRSLSSFLPRNNLLRPLVEGFRRMCPWWGAFDWWEAFHSKPKRPKPPKTLKSLTCPTVKPPTYPEPQTLKRKTLNQNPPKTVPYCSPVSD